MAVRSWRVGDVTKTEGSSWAIGSHLAGDIVEEGRQVAHVCSGEDGVEHLALFLVLSTVRRQQARTNKETSETAMM